ncbi:MAG: hypothetical protein BECKG1743D_GA0114223_111881, partial [Candidatus Kentron sp. G]
MAITTTHWDSAEHLKTEEDIHLNCYGSRYFGGSVPHTGRGNRGTSRQPDSAHGQRILALRMCQ